MKQTKLFDFDKENKYWDCFSCKQYKITPDDFATGTICTICSLKEIGI